MGIFYFLKKKKAEKCLTYEQFNQWADNTLSLTIPKEVVAFCFNIYDDGDNKWSIELVGAGSFDKNNSDWACDEVCVNRDNPLMWKCNESWDVALAQVRDVVLRYLKEGKYSHILKRSKGVAVGFVDGDLIYMW